MNEKKIMYPVGKIRPWSQN